MKWLPNQAGITTRGVKLNWIKAVKIMDDNKVVRYRLPAEEKGRWVKILHDCKAGPKLVADCKKHGFPDFPADQVAQKYVDALQKVGYAFEIVPNYIMD